MRSNQSRVEIQEKASQAALDDIVRLLEGAPAIMEHERGTWSGLTGTRLVELLTDNFSKLDKDKNNRISKTELIVALGNPDSYSEEEYVMLILVAKYFGTIANLYDDEPGEDTMLSKRDVIVLGEYLSRGNVTLADVRRWCPRKTDKPVDPRTFFTPPPLG